MTKAWHLPFWAIAVLLAALCAAVLLLAVRVAPVPEHIHAHLTVSINGVEQTVPANTGINAVTGVTQPLHTHDTTGILHVESPVQETFELGRFFDEWGLALQPSGVGGVQQSSTENFTVFVNQAPYSGDPAQIVLTNRMDIDLVFTPRGAVAVPSPAFDWPPQY
ncbi:hypothetical protein [Subtercola endophyticus]|uniref:hypothetical protein n=1 Tax=Subtercola endophyticus TaxID=2895559 RepID=UPI001E50E4FD|nr:hypothetical protein [Subtercola endophyticus]UFS61031.1 hypothetical protein LQ955_10000 [Subtercola endophyticus]